MKAIKISFAEKYPDLVSEWSDRNKIKPDQISYGSNKKVWWKGTCGHEWEAIIKNRSNGSGCPKCRKIYKQGLSHQSIVRRPLYFPMSRTEIEAIPG